MIFFLSSRATAASGVGDVVFLTNEEYLPVLKEAIRAARIGIYIEMYLIRPGIGDHHPVDGILSELSAARKRGVQVRVILDRHFEKDNRKAAERLKAGGVWDVLFDDPETINHTKLVMIDDEVLILGSQNWTLSALAASNESAIYVRNRDVVLELKDKIKRAAAPARTQSDADAK